MGVMLLVKEGNQEESGWGAAKLGQTISSKKAALGRCKCITHTHSLTQRVSSSPVNGSNVNTRAFSRAT